MKYYDVSETEVKVPAGWLIEQAGFKGNALETLAFINQALVLVNYGNAVRNIKCFKKYSRNDL
jgi:UDP-N-acetylmuramate dehydrogenase